MGKVFAHAGVKFNQLDNEGFTPLLHTIARRSMAFKLVSEKGWLTKFDLKEPLSGSRTPTPLALAASLGKADMVRALLDAGSDPNSTDGQGNKAILLAAYQGHEEIVEVLLAAGGKYLTSYELSSRKITDKSKEMAGTAVQLAVDAAIRVGVGVPISPNILSLIKGKSDQEIDHKVCYQFINIVRKKGRWILKRRGQLNKVVLYEEMLQKFLKYIIYDRKQELRELRGKLDAYNNFLEENFDNPSEVQNQLVNLKIEMSKIEKITTKDEEVTVSRGGSRKETLNKDSVDMMDLILKEALNIDIGAATHLRVDQANEKAINDYKDQHSKTKWSLWSLEKVVSGLLSRIKILKKVTEGRGTSDDNSKASSFLRRITRREEQVSVASDSSSDHEEMEFDWEYFEQEYSVLVDQMASMKAKVDNLGLIFQSIKVGG